ncbi:hypothetical protein EAX61_14055 [Dokdonia sinensis]|uniref:Uncharacterized protein n=1 Tax=Dokdonia sinensis TaxID=2479847 RepID=A0A3M0FVK8_9FLAO|nr:hypothetical protein [Dokdonia sinensis]RMB56528.1 hypothetical protein EAX61_14055 [Dokdonia sinensis]
MRFEIQSYNSDTRSVEPNLILGDTQMEEILESINSYDRKNYTFKLNTINGGVPGYISRYNLVVKETLRGTYSYITEYRFTTNWVQTQSGGVDWSTYTGELLYYTDIGQFVGTVEMADGQGFTSFLNDPCDDGGSSNGGGSNDDGGTSGDIGTGDSGNGDSGNGDFGNGDSGNTGTSGEDDGGPIGDSCEWYIYGDGECNCIPTTVVICPGDETDDQKTIEDILRNPACETPDDCNQQNDCEFGFDANCGCLPEEEEEIENEDVGMNVDIDEYLIAVEIEDNITSTNLDPCSNNILTQLKNLQQNDIANIIYRFGAPDLPYIWQILTGVPPINPNNAGETDWKRDEIGEPMDYNYVTHIQPAYAGQATKMSIARSILHELVHAHLISLVDDSVLTGSNEVTNFPLLWNALLTETYDDNPNQLQHEIIARKFIEPIEDALKEWDNSQESDQYYRDLAWGALFETSTFNYVFQNDLVAKNRIINTNMAEDTNSVQNGVTPKSNPC